MLPRLPDPAAPVLPSYGGACLLPAPPAHGTAHTQAPGHHRDHHHPEAHPQACPCPGRWLTTPHIRSAG